MPHCEFLCHNWQKFFGVLYDRELLDDELYAVCSLFRPGVRMFVLSDSCHCGAMTKTMFLDPTPFLPRLEARVRSSTGVNLRPKFRRPRCRQRPTRGGRHYMTTFARRLLVAKRSTWDAV